jgi:glycosyltransferase involved in cell wall biosynthesis
VRTIIQVNIFKSNFRRLADATRPLRWRMAVLAQAALALGMGSAVMLFPRLAKRLAPIKALPAGKGERHVLFVSYYAPPYKSRYGTQRVAKFSRYLVRLGWQVTFLTTQPRRDDETDPEGEALDPCIEICHVPAIVDHPLMRQGALPPDDFVVWSRAAVEGIKTLLESRSITVIVATAPPYTNMLAAAICSVRSGVPLVTDFRDPWTRIDVVWVLKNALAKRISAFLERRVLGVSARVVMADETRYVSDYFVDGSTTIAGKLISITNGYDEADFEAIEAPDAAPGPTHPFSISYVGGFYSEQNCHAIMNVLGAWASRYPADMRDVVFDYAGGEARHVLSYADVPCEFRDHGYVSHHEAIQLRNRCDIQLFAQPDVIKPHVFSGKIFEMIRIPRPILALTREEGAVARLLAETGTGIALNPGDVAQAARTLKTWFDEWKRTGRVAYGGDRDVIARYSRTSLSKQLSDVLDTVRREAWLG